MRVLVTGGAGFIGSHVVELLVESGADVVVLDSLAAHDGEPDYLPPSVDLRVADLLDERAVQDAVAGVDAVCHQAARVGLGVDLDDVTDYVRDNDAGTATLLRELWRRSFGGRLVVASSMVVYGEGRYTCPTHGLVPAPPRRVEDLRAGRFEPRCQRCAATLSWVAVTEDAGVDPRNVYAATKVHTEHLSFAYGRETGARVCALRYHNVYGPRMPRDTPYAGVASIFRSAYEGGWAPRVFEDGGQMRDFVHVHDVARANVLGLESTWHGACNIASGQPRSVLEMASTLGAGYAGRSRTDDGADDGMDAGTGAGLPAPVVTGEFRPGDVRHVVASPDLAADVLEFRARIGFAEGMAAFAGEPLR